MSRNDTIKQLEAVNTAIEKVLEGGQSYKIGSRSLTRADLAELRKMKAELASEEESSGNSLDNTFVACFDRR
ncbi:hypothetical protein FACS1894127_6290 [Clostridia bacterium]|nr:hypothetical protein FACS1894127_6290 [Clostridia bacterium]